MALGRIDQQLTTAALQRSQDSRALSKCVRCYHSKVSIVILLLWNALVGFGYVILEYGPLDIINSNGVTKYAVYAGLGAYGLLGIAQMLYPIGGLLADIYCGRYRVTISSILIVWCGYFLGTTAGILDLTSTSRNVIVVLEALALLAFTLGFTGFRANAVQFSLDQLQEASSERISLFLHWFMWSGYIGEAVSGFLILMKPLKAGDYKTIMGYSAIVFLIISSTCVVLTLCVHKSFYRERVSRNPYWNVWKVVKFAAKHGKPLRQCSAFTYCDNNKPTRIDFAKRIYGGQFNTEVVEDVKTFLRMVFLLLAITPVFLLEVPTRYLYPLFGLHLGKNTSLHMLSYQWILFQSGILSFAIPVISITVYLFVIRPYIKQWLPRMITRIGIGITIKVASVISMFIIQIVDNYTAPKSISTNTTCFFLAGYTIQGDYYRGLDFSTQALIIPNILTGVAEPLISITILEFISAQSPHTMKGLLLGVFYAFKGLFLTLGSVAALPFAPESLWGHQHGMLDCGFYYYLSNSVFGVFGLVVFILAARWYRYRERDDPPYSHKYAEDYYSQHLPDKYGSINS